MKLPSRLLDLFASQLSNLLGDDRPVISDLVGEDLPVICDLVGEDLPVIGEKTNAPGESCSLRDWGEESSSSRDDVADFINLLISLTLSGYFSPICKTQNTM